MKLDKKLKDIKFNNQDISEPIVMQSTGGWYIGQVKKDPDLFGLPVPYDRLSDYYSLEDARNLLKEQNETKNFHSCCNYKKVVWK
tara:strand:+ start:396 stop:650 length:255 start_codon:yes stop_codon:yes gene_type:complete